jgi:glycosyltransferase involved in cell wall biosynthesis
MKSQQNLTPIPVVELITDLNFGGAQTSLQNFLRHIDCRTFSPFVVTLRNGNTILANQIQSLQIPVIDLNIDPKFRIDRILRLYYILKQNKIAILHTWLYHANLVGRLAGRAAKVPVIITSRHNINIGGYFREQVNRFTSPLDDQVIAVSEYVREIEIARSRVEPNKVVKIYNGVDISSFSGTDLLDQNPIRHEFKISSGAPLLGSIGRLHPQKGYSYLIESMGIILDQYPEAKLLIVGTGELENEIKSQVNRMGLSQSIIFTGIRADIPSILAALDIFILSSLWEGHPIVILEAMAAGVPVVATAVGGTPEIITAGETGILVQPRDPEGLSDAVMRLISNRELRTQIAQAGKKRALDFFTVENMTRRIESLYLLLLKQKNPGFNISNLS